MPAIAGSTTFSRRKQKMGRSPSLTETKTKPQRSANQTKTRALKPLKYSRITQLVPAPRREVRGQADRSVAQSHQPAHRMAERLEEAAHLAVAALLQYHSIPAVAAFALAVVLDALEPSRLAVELDACK